MLDPNVRPPFARPERIEPAMPAPKPIRVAAVQMEPRIGEVDANLGMILERFREATAAGARLVVFPECALTGYGFETKDERS